MDLCIDKYNLKIFKTKFIAIQFHLKLFLTENIGNQIEKLSTMILTTSNSCFDQNVKMVGLLTRLDKDENHRVIQFSTEDRDFFRSSLKEFGLDLVSSLDRASQKISTGEV